MLIEEMIELLSQIVQLTRVAVFDTSCTDHSLKELSLKNNLDTRVNVIRFNAKSLVKLLNVLVLFFVFRAAGVVVLLGSVDRLVVALASIDEVKLVDLRGTQKGEVVLATLVVNAIKLGQTAINTDDVSVSKNTPDLSQGHRE